MKILRSTLSQALAVLLVLPLMGCNRRAQVDSAILARVGDREFRQADLQTEIKWRVEHNRPVPTLRALLEELVAQEVLVQKARASGLDKDSEYLRACRVLLASNYKEKELRPRLDELSVSEAEIRTEYEKHKNDYALPAKVRLAVIQIGMNKPSPEKRAELTARMQDARAKALAWASDQEGFGQIAFDYSEDQASRFKGGDIGWFDVGQTNYRWPAELIAAGFELGSNGTVSQVLEIADSLYLVKRMDVRNASWTPLAQVEGGLRRRLLTEKKQSVEQDFRSSAQQGLAVSLFPEAIANLPAPIPNLAQRTAEPPGMP